MIAVVLAGGPPDALAMTQPGALNKAYVRIGGITLVERTLRSLRESTRVGRVVVVTPAAAHGDPALECADEFRIDGEKITTSLRNGLAGLPPNDAVLVTASDLPVLTGAAVDDFADRIAALGPDIGYGCVERRVHEARFPQIPHTWARLREGTYCGGGMIAIKPCILPDLERFIEQLGAARKNPLQLASLFGWDILLRFALRQLSIAQAEARASRIVGANIRAIVSPFAETAVNVDRVSDIPLAEALVL